MINKEKHIIDSILVSIGLEPLVFKKRLFNKSNSFTWRFGNKKVLCYIDYNQINLKK